jgi:hypothetical protein
MPKAGKHQDQPDQSEKHDQGIVRDGQGQEQPLDKAARSGSAGKTAVAIHRATSRSDKIRLVGVPPIIHRSIHACGLEQSS